MIVDLDALTAQLGVQHLRHQRNAAAAAGTGAGFALQRGDGMAAALDRFDDVAFADVEAGANLRAIRQRIDPHYRLFAAARRQDQPFWIFRQRDGVEHQLQQIAVVAGIADQHRAEQGFAIFADDQAFVDRTALIQPDVAARARRTAARVADAADVHAEQLEFGAHVGALEGAVAAG